MPSDISLPVGGSRVVRSRGIVGQVGWQTSDRSILAVMPSPDGSARVIGLRPGVATLTLYVSRGGPSVVRAMTTVSVGGLPVPEIAWDAAETMPNPQVASWGYWPNGLR